MNQQTAASQFAAPPAASVAKPKPMISERGAAALLGKTMRQTRNMAEEGKIPFAINVAFDAQLRVCLRISQRVIADLMQGRECVATWPQILASILPPGRDPLNTKDLEFCLNIVSEHACRIVRSGCFEGSTKGRTGPGGSALLPRGSVEAWLQQRIWPPS